MRKSELQRLHALLEKPVWKRLFAIFPESGMKTMLHSGCLVRAILAELVNAGLHIPGDSPSEGSKHGCRGVQAGIRPLSHVLQWHGNPSYLTQGSPEDIRHEVLRLIDMLGENGRYVFCRPHLLTDDLPVESVMAIDDEAKTYRRF